MSLIFDQLLGYWMPVLGLLMLIATLISILAYLFGVFLQDERIKSASRAGFIEIFYSAVIVGLVMFTVNAANDVVKYLVVGNTGQFIIYAPAGDTYQRVDLCRETGTFLADNILSPYYGIPYCHMRVGMYFLNTLFNEIDGHALKIYLSYLKTSTLADLAINIEFVFEKAGFFTITPQRGFFVMGNLIKTFAFETSIKLMGVLKFQEVLLSFISKALFPALFMLGIILRTFMFTRKIGGLLMAIALVLFFIYPMFYVFGGVIIQKIKDDFRTSADLNPNIADYMYNKGTIPEIIGPGFNLEREQQETERLGRQGTGAAIRTAEEGRTNINLANRPDISDADAYETAGKGLRWFYELGTKNWYDPYVVSAFEEGGEVDVLSRLAFFSVFFGLLGILAAIASIRSLSVMLGGDIEIAGLTHLI